LRLTLHLSVTNARESAARDSTAIATGVPSRALMQRAGAAAAGEIARLFGDDLAHGVLVYAGPGNNGGDGWVVARCLAASGVHVHVVPVVESTTTPRNSPFAFGSVAATWMTAPDQSDFFAPCTLVESEHATPSTAATAPMANLVGRICLSG